MQFIKDGPDIPDRLLQLHEEGRVVFFCGAGISYPAGLPGFSGLVTRLFDALGVNPNGVQQAAIKSKQFDTAIGLLESDIVGQREIVRKALATILTPELTAKGATSTHEALLTLGRTREGKLRLITTNFDRLFEEAIAKRSLTVETFKAPLLPVPNSRWDGLVYLHGLIPNEPTVSALNQLVVASGDFGRAYLTERWAARFVSELFRGYSVCFVGYSIADPVLRYMMDALAADRLLGESWPETFAFGSSPAGKESERKFEWLAKNVTPIVYRETKSHSFLHNTFRTWAGVYRDGASGKERIIVNHAIARPVHSTKQDDFVGRVIWAISDRKGLPAKRFADLEPVPSLDWLEAFCENRYKHADLCRFAIPTNSPAEDELEFSLTQRPAPYQLAPWMTLVDSGHSQSQWDNVMYHIARWLIRHLDEPKLLLWLAERGGCIHKRFLWMISQALQEISNLEQAGNQQELDRRRAIAPRAIPRPNMRILWRLMLSGHVRRPVDTFRLYDWLERLKRDGSTACLRLELREILAPRVALRKPFPWSELIPEGGQPEQIKDLVQWEVVISTRRVQSTLRDFPTFPAWEAALMEMLPDFSMLLKDAFDLMRELGGANDRHDHSYSRHFSIERGHQFIQRDGWSVLVDLTRDAWLALAKRSVDRARAAAEGWWQTPYPIFKRLAFFAAAQEGCIPPARAAEWLLADNHLWLWSPETMRESIRLLIAVYPQLADPIARSGIDRAILAGPPRSMFKDEPPAERWTQIKEHAIWLRLAKIKAAGAEFGQETATCFDDLTARWPDWKLAENARDEFPIWVGKADSMEWTGSASSRELPLRRRELVEWLRLNPGAKDEWNDDGWRNYNRERFPTAVCAFIALCSEGVWLEHRMNTALQVWSDHRFANRVWRWIGPLLSTMPTPVLASLSQSISFWIQALARTRKQHDSPFIDLCRRLLDLDYPEDEPSDDPVFEAINHPVGHVTDALLGGWYRNQLEDNQGLHGEERAIFSNICRTELGKFRHGRVILATHVIALFRVDPAWSMDNLLPLFDWRRSSSEAHGAWVGFLGSPRIYGPLMEALKDPFFETVKHYQTLGQYGEQYAALLTIAALDASCVYSTAELREVFSRLPGAGLEEAAQFLGQLVGSAGDQRADYWKNRVSPFLRKIWPKSRDRMTSQLSGSMAVLCIAADEAFPQAFLELKPWLQQQRSPFFPVYQLKESDLCRRFPGPALAFLDAIIGDDRDHSLIDLRECIVAIKDTDPKLTKDDRLKRLEDIVRA